MEELAAINIFGKPLPPKDDVLYKATVDALSLFYLISSDKLSSLKTQKFGNDEGIFLPLNKGLRNRRIKLFLEQQFGQDINIIEKPELNSDLNSNSDADLESDKYTIVVSGYKATIDIRSLSVDCSHSPLANRLTHLLKIAATTVDPMKRV